MSAGVRRSSSHPRHVYGLLADAFQRKLLQLSRARATMVTRENGQLQRDIVSFGPTFMDNVTQLLSAIEGGDSGASAELASVVYDALRRLAAQKLAHEAPGQTLQATALVHEAYLRLVNVDKAQQWRSRGHFFAAAAEAMRRILVDNARRKRSLKRGGDKVMHPLDEAIIAAPEESEDLVALDEALDRLASNDPEAAELVKLRYFAGFTSEESAEILGISTRTAERAWSYARTFLLKELQS